MQMKDEKGPEDLWQVYQRYFFYYSLRGHEKVCGQRTAEIAGSLT